MCNPCWPGIPHVQGAEQPSRQTSTRASACSRRERLHVRGWAAHLGARRRHQLPKQRLVGLGHVSADCVKDSKKGKLECDKGLLLRVCQPRSCRSGIARAAGSRELGRCAAGGAGRSRARRGVAR
eukprot:365902-Chlamydomonas_euryale.AAC.3